MIRNLWRAGREWNNDNASFLGAALAYYSLFSVAPLLMLAIAIAGLVFGSAAAEGRVYEFLEEYVGAESAKAIQKLVLSSTKLSFGSWSSIIASCILIYAAVSLFRQLKTALDIVWKLPPIVRHGVVGWLHDLLLAVILVAFTGLFVVFLTTASVVNAYLADLPAIHQFGPVAWRSLEFGAVFLLQTLILGFTYRFLSEGRIRYRHIWGGAIVAALLLTLGKSAFSLYLSYSHFNTIYGAAGSIVVFLVWIYYSAQIVFFGAEVIKVRISAIGIDARRGRDKI